MISLRVCSVRQEPLEVRNGYSQGLAEWLTHSRESWNELQALGSHKRLQRPEEAQKTMICSQLRWNARIQHRPPWEAHQHSQLWCLMDWGWYSGLLLSRHGILGNYHTINVSLRLVVYRTWIMIPTSLNDRVYEVPSKRTGTQQVPISLERYSWCF